MSSVPEPTALRARTGLATGGKFAEQRGSEEKIGCEGEFPREV